MLVLAMEFSRGTAARGRRSLTAEQEQLGRVLDRLWDSLEQALGFYHDRAERSRLASDRLGVLGLRRTGTDRDSLERR